MSLFRAWRTYACKIGACNTRGDDAERSSVWLDYAAGGRRRLPLCVVMLRFDLLGRHLRGGPALSLCRRPLASCAASTNLRPPAA